MDMFTLKLQFDGTSHGKGYCGTIEGMPSGYDIDVDVVNSQLALRKGGYGRSNRQTEQDKVVLGGLVDGKTSDSITFCVDNSVSNIECRPQITALRSGHIDVIVANKYGSDTVRYHNEYASGRNSLCYVVAGSIAQQILWQKYGIQLLSHTTSIGGVVADVQLMQSSDNCQLLCNDIMALPQMKAVIDSAVAHNNSVGGTTTVVAMGVPMGLGHYFPYNKRIDGIIAGGMMSIPSVKAVEIGIGKQYATSTGSDIADSVDIVDDKYIYTSNNCGGVVGGMTTGQPIVVTLTVKPTPTVEGTTTIDSVTHNRVPSHYERADSCIVPSVGIIARNILALQLLDILITQ